MEGGETNGMGGNYMGGNVGTVGNVETKGKGGNVGTKGKGGNVGKGKGGNVGKGGSNVGTEGKGRKLGRDNFETEGKVGIFDRVVCVRWRAARLMLMLDKVRARRNAVRNDLLEAIAQ
ncbi:hypothetical protein CR513_31064, partial [Mucuna pruriens]